MKIEHREPAGLKKVPAEAQPTRPKTPVMKIIFTQDIKSPK